jgi:hypothetical protein
MHDRLEPDAPVTCLDCDADGFAIGATREETITGHVHVTLRCGACGLWQDRTLSFREAARFHEHHEATRRQITRLLVAYLRAEALGR